MKNHLTDLINYHCFFEQKIQEKLMIISKIDYLKKGHDIIKKDQYIKWFIILLEGKIRVWHQQDDREVTLYTISKYETCAYSIVSIEKQYQSQVYASAITDSIILKIPTYQVKALKKFASWQTYINHTLINKYENLLSCINTLSFKKIDQRIMEFLQNESELNNNSIIEISHQKLASEIGSTREVVSRKLKELEKKGILKLDYRKILLIRG